jgi:hypothetical protein
MLMGMLIGAAVGAGIAITALIVVMTRRPPPRWQERVARGSQTMAAQQPTPQPSAAARAPAKRRLPGVAATNAYVIVPRQSPPNVWSLVPPKTMDFSDSD